MSNSRKHLKVFLFSLAAAAVCCLAACVREPARAARTPRWKAAASRLAIDGVPIDVSTDEDCQVQGRNGAVATGGRESMKAALEILIRGGNAFDAAAATLLALTVEEYTKFCFGGEASIITWSSDDEAVEVLCGQGRAPRLAALDYFLEHGGIPAPRSGDPANAPVPGALHAILTMLEGRGTMTFQEVAAPALLMLKAPIDSPAQAWRRDMARTLETLIQADVRTRAAGGLREEGIFAVLDEFYGYEGSVAASLAQWCEQNGALIRMDDLAACETLIETPVCADYRGFTICKCDTWTQGPYLLETLGILEEFDLRAMGHDSPQYIHTVIEALKLGLADRDNYFGDPLFVPVPLEELLSEDYLWLRRMLISPDTVTLEVGPGDPVSMLAELPLEERAPGPASEVHDTTTCIVADRWGNIVVATPSGWGGVLAGETGIWLSSRLSSFNTWEGHPNCIEPFKRPRITLTPTLVLKDGRPAAAISVAGGDQQDQVTLSVLLNVIEFEFSPGEAVTLPRFGTGQFTSSFSQEPPKPASLQINEEVGEEVIRELARKGHEVEPVKGAFWCPSIMVFNVPGGPISAAGDPQASRNSGAF